MEKKQETVYVCDFLNEKLKEAKKKHGEYSRQAIFINCAIAGIADAEKGDLQIEPGFFSYQLCPDQYVGQIKESEDWNEFTRKPVFNDEWEVINIPKGEKIMIMILESPHKDEFKGKIGPAKGTTGRNLGKMTRLCDFYLYRNYELILMNAIPFQCSLGEKPEKFKDEVFANAWNEENQKIWNEENQKIRIGKSFFKERLCSLLKELDGKFVVIVNACTSGGCRKQAVQDVIDEIALDIKRAEIPHPSSWRIPELKSL